MFQNDIVPPVATLAILTYNQRDYIIEAIKGAVAQDYDDLEIIISDDCSTDDTFELIKNFVESYTGARKLVVNQTSGNKCTLGHFFDVVDIATGNLLILAAGDDISYSERVSETVSVWQKDGAVGLHSNYDLIDNSGSTLKRNFSPNSHSAGVDKIFGQPRHYEIHGASSAYDLEFVKSLPRPVGRFLFEDTFMAFMIKLHGRKVSKIDKVLVAYRSHSTSLSNNYILRKSFNDTCDGERKAEFYSANRHDLLCFLFKHASTFSKLQKISGVNLPAIKNHLSMLDSKSRWTRLSIGQRVRSLFVHRRNSEFFRWMLPRLLGLNFFSALRCFRNI